MPYCIYFNILCVLFQDVLQIFFKNSPCRIRFRRGNKKAVLCTAFLFVAECLDICPDLGIGLRVIERPDRLGKLLARLHIP